MNSEISKDIHITKDGEQKNHQAFAMELSRLKKAKEECSTSKNCTEFKRLGGEEKLKEVENLVRLAQNANYQVKKTGMNAGRENQFKKAHEKDVANANPTGLGGIPKVASGSINDKIMNNREVYNEEISKIKYLIEYMDNNKTLKP